MLEILERQADSGPVQISIEVLPIEFNRFVGVFLGRFKPCFSIFWAGIPLAGLGKPDARSQRVEQTRFGLLLDSLAQERFGLVHLFALSEHHDQSAKRILVRRIGLQKLSNRRFGFLKPTDRSQGFDGQLDRFFILRIGFDRLEQIVDSIIDILPRYRPHDDDFGKLLLDFRIALSRIDHGLELDACQIERFATLVDFLPQQVDPCLEHISVDKLRVRLDGRLQVLHGLVGDLRHACGRQPRSGQLL